MARNSFHLAAWARLPCAESARRVTESHELHRAMASTVQQLVATLDANAQRLSQQERFMQVLGAMQPLPLPLPLPLPKWPPTFACANVRVVGLFSPPAVARDCTGHTFATTSWWTAPWVCAPSPSCGPRSPSLVPWRVWYWHLLFPAVGP
jgi:hypothetical protein